MTDSVAVGFIHDEKWDCWFGHSLMGLLLDDLLGPRKIAGRYIGLFSGPMIDTARNQVCQAFLDHPDAPEWLLMVDSDMTFTPSDFYHLLTMADRDERPVVGGLCFAGGPTNIWPVMLVARESADEEIGFTLQQVREYPKNTLCKVDATGAAFLLVHRRVLEEMLALDPESPAPWFRFSYLGKRQFGEDVPFCLRCRALGIPIYVHTGVKIGHVKTRVINEEVYEEHVAKHGHDADLMPVAVGC